MSLHRFAITAVTRLANDIRTLKGFNTALTWPHWSLPGILALLLRLVCGGAFSEMQFALEETVN